MKDFCGKLVKKGDKVAFVSAYTIMLLQGTIVSSTSDMVRIKCDQNNIIVNRESDQIIKI